MYFSLLLLVPSSVVAECCFDVGVTFLFVNVVVIVVLVVMLAIALLVLVSSLAACSCGSWFYPSRLVVMIVVVF